MEGSHNHEAVQKYEAAKSLLDASEDIQAKHVQEAQKFLNEIRSKR